MATVIGKSTFSFHEYSFYSILRPSKLVQAVTPLMCIRRISAEAPPILTHDLRGSLQCLQENAAVVPQIRPLQFPSTFLPAHYPLNRPGI
jgi:hypothetical protein